MKKIYKFYWNCGHMGNLEGKFVADEEEVKNTIGKEVYFGEVLGKHSEIYGTLDEEDIEVISDDQDFIQKLVEIMGNDLGGYNPLDYVMVKCPHCGYQNHVGEIFCGDCGEDLTEDSEEMADKKIAIAHDF